MDFQSLFPENRPFGRATVRVTSVAMFITFTCFVTVGQDHANGSILLFVFKLS